MKLQKEQEEILNTKNKDIIVSAGAGSGKTFVMIEKIFNTIISTHTPVTKLLVVTFTNAAATEMHQKLEKKLREQLTKFDPKSKDYAFILEQINQLPQSNICTLHKFCQNIISKYFYAIDLDVGFSIADETEIKMLKNKALDDVLSEIEQTEEKPLVNLLYIYDRKRDNSKIKNIIQQIYNYLENLPNVQEFKDRVLEAYLKPLNENQFCNIINSFMVERCSYYEKVFSALAKSVDLNELNEDDSKKFLECCAECLNVAKLINKDNSFTQNVHILFSGLTNLNRLPKFGKDAELLKEELKQTKTAFSKELGKFEEYCIMDDPEKLYADLKKNSEIMQGLFVLYDRFKAKFEELKHKRNLLDFSNLEHFCMKILSNDDIREEVKQSFAAVYVDEYQDINDIQEKIISLVHTPGNLFLVGDVKQSIYGFRNTNPQIFIDKVQGFDEDKNKSSIRLNCNFRSDQRVLDFVNLVFSKIMTNTSVGVDYQNTSLMGSDQIYEVPNASTCSVEVDVINTEDSQKSERPISNGVYSVKDAEMQSTINLEAALTEGDVVAEKILQMINQQKQIFDAKLGENGELRNIKFGDISILCQNRNSILSAILQRIREHGIPVEDFGGENIFNSYEIQLLYNYLRLINNSCDDVALTTLLSSPIINLNDDELLAIRMSNEKAKHFYECLNCVEDDEIKAKINKLKALVEMGHQNLVNSTVFDCLNNFIQTTNFESLISLLPSGKARVINAQTFVNHFVGKSYNNCLFDFINFVESNDNMLDLEKSGEGNEDIVHVLTMHHSKGLEYPIVFLVNLGHNFNMNNQREEIVFHESLGVGLYAYDYNTKTKRNTLSRQAIILMLKKKALAENLRLLYVAMTRAKNNLFLVGKTDLQKFTPSTTTFDLQNCKNFMELVLSGVGEAVQQLSGKNFISVKAIDYRKKTNKHIFDLFSYPVVQHESKNAELLTKPLKLSNYVPEFEQKVKKMMQFNYQFAESTKIGLKNSVTSLNKSSNQELETNFHEDTQNFYLHEEKQNTSSELGTIYHKAMELIDFNLDSEEEIKQYLLTKMNFDELNKIDCGKILACTRALRDLVNTADLVQREQAFMLYVPHNSIVKNSTITDKILVQGIIDLVLYKGDEAILIDYKLTKTKNEKELAKRYATQLKCYSMAIEKSKGVKVTKKILYSFLQEMQIIV